MGIRNEETDSSLLSEHGICKHFLPFRGASFHFLDGVL